MRSESWVILEITSKGEEAVEQGTLKRSLLEVSPFKEGDIFIPIVKHGGKPVWVMEGYIFIKSGYGASDYFDLRRTYLIRNVVSQIDESTGLISKGVISTRDLNSMLKRADELGARFDFGDKVAIKDGEFKGFEATVLDLFEKDSLMMYSLLIDMRSVEIIISADCLSVESV